MTEKKQMPGEPPKPRQQKYDKLALLHFVTSRVNRGMTIGEACSPGWRYWEYREHSEVETALAPVSLSPETLKRQYGRARPDLARRRYAAMCKVLPREVAMNMIDQAFANARDLRGKPIAMLASYVPDSSPQAGRPRKK